MDWWAEIWGFLYAAVNVLLVTRIAATFPKDVA